MILGVFNCFLVCLRGFGSFSFFLVAFGLLWVFSRQDQVKERLRKGQDNIKAR